MRDVRAVMHVGIASAVAGKTFPAFQAYEQPTIFRIWQEAQELSSLTLYEQAMKSLQPLYVFKYYLSITDNVSF